jgi:hypothetical protein
MRSLLLPAAARAELPLEPAGLPEERATSVLAPGVTHTAAAEGFDRPEDPGFY